VGADVGPQPRERGVAHQSGHRAAACRPEAFDIGTGGVPVYLPPGGLSESPYAILKGRPVIPVEYCATLGTVGDIILADFTQVIASRRARMQCGQLAFTSSSSRTK
jgi:hypothetical protein